MTIDLRGALRRRKPEKQQQRLTPRPIAEDARVDRISRRPAALVLDTTVYIHNAAGTLPRELRAIVDQSLLFHCSVALAELAIGVANADPTHPSWSALRRHYAELFDAIPATRLLTPDAQTMVEAGLIAGTLARTQRFQRH